MSAKSFLRAMRGPCAGALLLPGAQAVAALSPMSSLPPFAESLPLQLAAHAELFRLELPGVLVALEGLSPDSRRYLVVGVLLLFVWLLHRRLSAARAAKRARDAKARRRVGASQPSYPGGDVTKIGATSKSKGKPGAERGGGGMDARIGADARVAAREASKGEEEDFTALYRQAVNSPRAGAEDPKNEAEPEPFVEPGLAWLDEQSASAPPPTPEAEEIDLDEDDSLFSLAGDDDPVGESSAEDAFDEDDPLFTLDGDEAPDAPESEAGDDGLLMLDGDDEASETDAGAEVPEITLDDDELLMFGDEAPDAPEPEADDDGLLALEGDEVPVIEADAEEPALTLEIDEAVEPGSEADDDDGLFMLEGDESLEAPRIEADAEEPALTLDIEDLVEPGSEAGDDDGLFMGEGDEAPEVPASAADAEEPTFTLDMDALAEPESEAEDGEVLFMLQGDEAPDAPQIEAEAVAEEPALTLEIDDSVESGAEADEDDGLFMLDGDEAPDAPRIAAENEAVAEDPALTLEIEEPVTPGPEADDVPAPAIVEQDITAASVPAGEAVPPVAASRVRQVRPRRGQERTPPLTIVEADEDEATLALVDAALEVLASASASEQCVAFRVPPEEVGDEIVATIVERFGAAGQTVSQLRVFVDADLVEADVTRARLFGRKLGESGIGLGLCAAEPRNRLPVMVKMTSAVLVRFDASAVDALIETDDGLVELARITGLVRERGADVLLATADPQGRETLLAGRAAGLRWEYLETPPAG